MSTTTLRAWLGRAPFSLSLSAGFFGFFAHAGFVSALESNDLVPELVTGASAGALVGGLWASGTSAARIEAELRPLRREHFWDPAPGFGLLRGDLFRARIAAMLGADVFERAPVRAALSAWDVRTRRTVVLDRGDLAQAICASCAFPVLLQPVRVGGRPMLDGGIADRPGHAGLDGRARRVLFHHLASRSPWRRSEPAIPKRDGMVTVTLGGLPRLGPFRLARGAEAFDRAREATLRALEAPVAEVMAFPTG
jgi:NTE family protein